MQTERTGRHLTLQFLLQKLIDKLILVILVGAHIHHHLATVGNHVVLSACMDDRHVHHRGAQELTHFLELMMLQELQILHRFIDGIHPFAAGCMPRLSVSYYVENH